jgi:hypothetical protein
MGALLIYTGTSEDDSKYYTFRLIVLNTQLQMDLSTIIQHCINKAQPT